MVTLHPTHVLSFVSSCLLKSLTFLLPFRQRSGRIEEEIEMLQEKLKNIEDRKCFSGSRLKMARSQGKKIQVTVDEERSRLYLVILLICKCDSQINFYICQDLFHCYMQDNGKSGLGLWAAEQF